MSFYVIYIYIYIETVKWGGAIKNEVISNNKIYFWLFHILMPYSIILTFVYFIFMSLIVLYFLHSTSVLSFFI